MTDEEAAARAHRAYNELTETRAIFDQMRASLVARWASTGFDKTDHREKLFNAYTTINAVETALREAVDAGRVVDYAAGMAGLVNP